VETFIEQGESAKTANRPELQRLLAFCQKKRAHQITAVIVYKIDRIARNTEDYIQIRAVLKRHGVEIKSTSEYFENTPAGKFMENIIANVAQFDNDVRTERTIGGMREAMREGRYVWQAPVGYKNIRVAGKATIAPDESASVIQDIFNRVAQNHQPIEETRRQFFGLSVRNQKPISRTQFYRLLRNEVYAGWIVKFGERHQGVFEPLVSQELFDQVQRVIKYRRRYQGQYNRNNPDFPLRIFLLHASGAKLTGSWCKGRMRKYPYYRFHKPKLNFRKETLEEDFARFLDRYQIIPEDMSLLEKLAKKQYASKTEQNQKKRVALKQQIRSLNEKQSFLITKSYQGVISDELLKQQLELLDQELFEATQRLLRLPNANSGFLGFIEKEREFLMNPGTMWQTASLALKRHLQWFYFTKGVRLEKDESKTSKKVNVFKADWTILNELSRMVTLLHRNTNNTDVPGSQTIEQIQELFDDLERLINPPP
jgi:DNA invertase Pin-like site-specific DNA recombinase